MLLHQSNAWLRYLARNIDILFHSIIIIILYVGLIFLMRYLGQDVMLLTHMPKIIFSIIFLLLLILVESMILSHWSTTVGKKFLKIKISQEDTDKIVFLDALVRTLKVWVKGLGLGIPIVSFITQISAFNHLNNEGITSWDKDGRFLVVNEKVAMWRIVLAIIVVVILYVTYVKFAR